MTAKAKRVIPKVSGLVKPDHISQSAIENMPVLSGRDETKALAASSAKQQPSEHSVAMLPIAAVRSSPYQNRKVNEVHVADLADIIKVDGLNQPITVRHLPFENVYEIIAGEHRFEAYKQLGYESIPATIKNSDDLGAARSLIFDNIHHRQLTDYEVFKGFRILQNMDKSISQRTLARDTGWSKTQVLRFLAFEKLPMEALLILDEHPDLIGANAVVELAKYAEAGHGERVTEAMQRILDGKLTQTRAAAWIGGQISPKTKPTPRTISKGGKTFCSVLRDGNTLKVNIANNVDAEVIETAIYTMLEDRAKQDLQ